MSKARFAVLASLLLSVSLTLVPAIAKYDPIKIVPSHIDQMTFTFSLKLETDTPAIEVAVHNPEGSKLVDNVITFVDAVTLNIPVIDPTTNLPQVGADGKPVTNPVAYPAGTILNPLANPADNLLLPKGLMVKMTAIADGDFRIGRFAYLGVAPRFESKNLEMFASKMGHTLRVKAYVTQSMLDMYEFTLLSKFKSYSDMFAQDKIHIEPLQSFKDLAAQTSSPSMKKWYSVVSLYSKHIFETLGLDIYDTPSSDDEYKRLILTRLIQTYLHNSSATVESGLALFDQYKRDPSFLLSRRAQSAALFRAQYKVLFVEGAPVPPVSPIAPLFVLPTPPAGTPVAAASPLPSPLPPVLPPNPHPDALGFVTFVYPIAIDKEGPFKLPSPGLKKFPLSSSIEGRWFSNRWLDEFNGLPFLQVTPDGVAFHAAISVGPDGRTVFLHRDNISHSCMRMDPSDLLELRAILPKNMTSLERLHQTVPLWITEWPDVADVDNSGTRKVVDVAYYTIPGDGSKIMNPLSYSPSVYNKTYWKHVFSPFSRPAGPKNKSRRSFTITTTPVVDPVTGETKNVNSGVFTGLPKYDVVNGVLRAVGYYTEPLPIVTFPQRPGQILQYREDGLVYSGADDDGADRWGSYPPAVVNKF